MSDIKKKIEKARKMHKIIFVSSIVIFLLSVAYIGSSIKSNGGIRNIIVESGKEVKSIYQEINNKEEK